MKLSNVILIIFSILLPGAIIYYLSKIIGTMINIAKGKGLEDIYEDETRKEENMMKEIYRLKSLPKSKQKIKIVYIEAILEEDEVRVNGKTI